MSYELYVYHRSHAAPPTEEIDELLDLAGWSFALVTTIDSLKSTTLDGSAFALGWEADGDSADLIEGAIAREDSPSLNQFSEELCVVDITSENPFEPDPDAVKELQSAGLDPRLVTRVQEATSQFGFRTARASDLAIEFQWALAGAVGVMVDGVLEDLEEGTLIDCTENDE